MAEFENMEDIIALRNENRSYNSWSRRRRAAGIIALRNEKDTTLICNRIFTIHLQLIEFQYLKIH